ncbi:glycosyltransferase family 4 protein [Photobacterium damselae]|uniref:glycosyltransferase family 4 protein n=1 Tax=Photobacterium damselae TaxID=38293 RepID=UPI004068535C
MKIIQIGPVVPELGGEKVGGVATHLCQLTESLLSLGYDVDVLTTIKKNNNNIVGMNARLKILKTIFRNPKLFINGFITKNYVPFYKKHYYDYIVDNYNPNDVIIHIHSLHNYFGDLLNNKYKVIYTDHGFWQSKDVNKKNILKRISKSKKIISVSHYAKEILKEFIDDESLLDKLNVIYNPIKMEAFCDFKKENTIFFNGYSDSLKRKGLDILYENVVCHYKDITFNIVCDTDGLEYLNGKNKDNINSYSNIPYKDIIKLYQKSKLMILPSKSESFGLVYIESLIYNTPVIGFKPIIDEFNDYLGCEIGYGFDPFIDTGHRLKELTDKALNNKWDFNKINRAIVDKFSWDNQISKYNDLYIDSFQ